MPAFRLYQLGAHSTAGWFYSYFAIFAFFCLSYVWGGVGTSKELKKGKGLCFTSLALSAIGWSPKGRRG